MTPVTATREGATLVLRVSRAAPGSAAQAAAQARAFDDAAPLLDRLLAAVSAGVMGVPVAEAMLRDTPRLRGDALALLAQGGALIVGPVVELRVSVEGG